MRLKRSFVLAGALTLAAASSLVTSTPAHATGGGGGADTNFPARCIGEKDLENQPYYVYFGEDYHQASPPWCPVSCSIWVGGHWCTY